MVSIQFEIVRVSLHTTSDLDELDGNLGAIHFCGLLSVSLLVLMRIQVSRCTEAPWRLQLLEPAAPRRATQMPPPKGSKRTCELVWM